MKIYYLIILFLLSINVQSQDSRDFYGSNTYFEALSLNDSILDINRNRDLIIDSKSTTINLSINDSVIQFKNTLNKADKSAFIDGTYSIRIKTDGYHFECLDKTNYLYSLDHLKLTDVRGNTIRVKAKYNIYKIKKKKKKLLSSKDVVFKINKDELKGVLFGIKYTYDPNDNIKKAKRKDIAKVVFYSTIISGGLGYAIYYWFWLRAP